MTSVDAVDAYLMTTRLESSAPAAAYARFDGQGPVAKVPMAVGSANEGVAMMKVSRPTSKPAVPRGSARFQRLYLRAEPWIPAVRWAAGHAGVDWRLVLALIHQESGFNHGAVSSAGALGIMQIMPKTAAALRVNPTDPMQNIWGGTWYLANLNRRYEGDLLLALAAYNAGPTAVERHRGIPPYRETQDYVRSILSMYQEIARHMPYE